jgi:hypothetical protein
MTRWPRIAHLGNANRSEYDATRRPPTHGVNIWKSGAEQQRKFEPADCDIGTRTEEAFALENRLKSLM